MSGNKSELDARFMMSLIKMTTENLEAFVPKMTDDEIARFRESIEEVINDGFACRCVSTIKIPDNDTGVKIVFKINKDVQVQIKLNSFGFSRDIVFNDLKSIENNGSEQSMKVKIIRNDQTDFRVFKSVIQEAAKWAKVFDYDAVYFVDIARSSYKMELQS
jgi:hypothetical protein